MEGSKYSEWDMMAVKGIKEKFEDLELILEVNRRLYKNDKQMHIRLDQYEEKSKKWLEVMEGIEERYDSNEIDEEEVIKRGLEIREIITEMEDTMIKMPVVENVVSLEECLEMVNRIKDERKRGGVKDSKERGIENKVEIEKEKVDQDKVTEKDDPDRVAEKKVEGRTEV